jgi:hypothetical protein
MQIAERTRDRLAIHQSPSSMRGFGVLLVLTGIASFVLDRGNVVFMLGGVGFAAVGLLVLHSADDRWIVFDGRARKVDLSSRNRLNSTHSEYSFDQIRDIALERNVQSGRGYPSWTYRPVFVLNDGERVPWTSEWTNDGAGRSRCVAAAREFGGWAEGLAALPTVPVEQLAPWARVRSSPITTALLLLLSLVLLAEAAAMGYRLVTWRPMPATVLQIKIERPPGLSLRRLPGDVPHISYRYTVDGLEYLKDRLTPIEGWIKFGGPRPWIARIALSYAPGSTVVAYVNPHNPREAFLSRDAVPVTWLLLPGLGLLAFNLFASWRLARRRAWAEALQPVPMFTSSAWERPRQASQ